MGKKKGRVFPSPFPYQSPGEILENSAFFQLTTAPQKGRGKGQRKKKETLGYGTKRCHFIMNLNWEKSLPKQYGFKALNNFTNLSLWTQYTDTMLVETIR